MTSFTNDDLYQMLLHRLRKDRRGSVSPEEFETFLRWRNLDHFDKTLPSEGVDKFNEAALSPFLVPFEPVEVTLDSQHDWYVADLSVLPLRSTANNYSVWRNVWFTTDAPTLTSPPYDYERPSLTNIIHVDVVSEKELPDRLTNAITAPSATYPIGYFTNSKLYINGIASTGFAVLSYYKLPKDPYYDYYTDTNGNVTYLTEDQSSYTLQAGEYSRGGEVAGEQVLSASVDLEWDDEEAMKILDMIVSDASIALSDPGSFQASLLERKEN